MWKLTALSIVYLEQIYLSLELDKIKELAWNLFNFHFTLFYGTPCTYIHTYIFWLGRLECRETIKTKVKSITSFKRHPVDCRLTINRYFCPVTFTIITGWFWLNRITSVRAFLYVVRIDQIWLILTT